MRQSPMSSCRRERGLDDNSIDTEADGVSGDRVVRA
jgi:hypothetical protein